MTRYYQEPKPISREQAERTLSSGSPSEISDVLVRLAYHEPDWRWVQNQCVRFLGYPNADVRGLAATCLGHLARIHGTVDKQLVVPALERLLMDPEIAGRAEDALADIKMFASDV